jgi:hypothetical protein
MVKFVFEALSGPVFEFFTSSDNASDPQSVSEPVSWPESEPASQSVSESVSESNSESAFGFDFKQASDSQPKPVI